MREQNIGTAGSARSAGGPLAHPSHVGDNRLVDLVLEWPHHNAGEFDREDRHPRALLHDPLPLQPPRLDVGHRDYVAEPLGAVAGHLFHERLHQLVLQLRAEVPRVQPHVPRHLDLEEHGAAGRSAHAAETLEAAPSPGPLGYRDTEKGWRY